LNCLCIRSLGSKAAKNCLWVTFILTVATVGLDHNFGHARVFFPDRQELAVAQTACRSSKNTLARPSCRGKFPEMMIKAQVSYHEAGFISTAQAGRCGEVRRPWMVICKLPKQNEQNMPES
jgi:hypothetical protein